VSALALKFRGPLIAIFVLLLSAGLALAGGGLTFPDAGSEGPTDGSAPAVAEGEDSDQWDNHGDLVSDAAQMETPDGFKNHGAFVSCVAKMRYGKKGSEAPADFVLAELAPEDCTKAEEDSASADEDSDTGHGKGKNKGKGKGHGRGR
jgi:hypothetical protein